jgi:hypothetical protein
MHFVLVARSGKDFQARFDASDVGAVIRREEPAALPMSPGVPRRLSGIVPIRPHTLVPGTRLERPGVSAWLRLGTWMRNLRLGLEGTASDEVPNGGLDGDVVFQSCKVEHAGLSDDVNGRVLIYIEEEEAFDNVERRYPVKQHVLVDDKLRILTAVRQFWGERVTTVFMQQGTYAHDHESGQRPADDVIIECSIVTSRSQGRHRVPCIRLKVMR